MEVLTVLQELTRLTYKGNVVRTVEQDGTIWWVLVDVCKVLEIANARNVSARLDEDEKGVHLVDTLGGRQKLTIINDSGLYASAAQRQAGGKAVQALGDT